MAESHFWQALSDTIQRAVNLRVITLVGDATVQGSLETLQVTAPAATAGVLVTDINLADGDITNIVSEKFLGPDYADLRAGHQVAVKQAQDIVERNVNILVTIAKELAGQLGALPEPSHGPERPTVTAPAAGTSTTAG